jgi:hypothetical protein
MNAIGVLLLLCGFFPSSFRAQTAPDDPIGFGDLRLGTSVLALPVTCLRPVVCEDRYDSVWVRIWHADEQIQRVDVVYTGRESGRGGEIRSSPITLLQAIRTHSIRNGIRTPRLGFAGNEGPYRIIVDFANGICYLAGAVTDSSLVTEVRYVPMTDPLVARAAALPLYQRGSWLVRAAILSPRYKNLVAESEASEAKRSIPAQGISLNSLDRRFMTWDWK